MDIVRFSNGDVLCNIVALPLRTILLSASTENVYRDVVNNVNRFGADREYN